MKKLFIAVLILVVLAAGAVGAFLLYRSKNVSAVDTWIGKQLVRITSSYIEPAIDFKTVVYTAPYHVEMKGATLTARDGTRVAEIGTLVVELAELPQSGQPLKIKQIVLDNAAVNLIEGPDGGFKGLVPFVRGTNETRRVEEDVKLSNVLRLEKIELRNGAITYQLADGSPPMTMSGLALDLDVSKATEAADGVWYDLDTSFGRAPQLTAAVKGSVNLDTMIARIASCDLEIDVHEQTIQSLPPQLQTILRDHDAKGALKISVIGTVPMMKALEGDAEAKVNVSDFNVAFGEYKFPISTGDLVVGLQGGVANLRTLDIRTLGGAITGSGTARLAETGRPADLQWKFSDLQVQELLRAGVKPGEEPKLAGVLNAGGTVRTALDDPMGSISGDGSLTLRDGRLVMLPIVQELAKVMNIGASLLKSSELSHRADAAFSLAPEGVQIRSMELTTEVLAVRGDGIVRYDGTMDVRLNGGPMEKIQGLFGKAGDLIGQITDKALKYKVHGRIGDPEVEVLPLGLGG